MADLQTVGGRWEGEALPGKVMETLAKESKNGIVISGLVSWMNVQRDTNAEGIWMTVALEQFNP